MANCSAAGPPCPTPWSLPAPGTPGSPRAGFPRAVQPIPVGATDKARNAPGQRRRKIGAHRIPRQAAPIVGPGFLAYPSRGTRVHAFPSLRQHLTNAVGKSFRPSQPPPRFQVAEREDRLPSAFHPRNAPDAVLRISGPAPGRLVSPTSATTGSPSRHPAPSANGIPRRTIAAQTATARVNPRHGAQTPPIKVDMNDQPFVASPPGRTGRDSVTRGRTMPRPPPPRSRDPG